MTHTPLPAPRPQARERCDLLVLAAPYGRSTPPEILDLLKSAKTSVLIWRPPPASEDSASLAHKGQSEPWANHH